MNGLINSKLNHLKSDSDNNLFSVGLSYLLAKEYSFAYLCFTKSNLSDLYTIYNKAFCYYKIDCFKQSYDLIVEAEKLFRSSSEKIFGDLPESFSSWEYENNQISPMPYNTPIQVAKIQFLKLKAELAFHLNLYDDLRAIYYLIGNKNKRINELVKLTQNNTSKY